MKMLLSLAPMVALALSAISFTFGADASQLRGGAFQEPGGEPGTIEPRPTGFKCARYCENPGNCTASACAITVNVCNAVVAQFSGKCEAGGPLAECHTAATNDFCFKTYSNPCTPEAPTCTQAFDGCGTQYRCQ